MQYLNKSFSVQYCGKKYRDGWNRIFNNINILKKYGFFDEEIFDYNILDNNIMEVIVDENICFETKDNFIKKNIVEGKFHYYFKPLKGVENE